MKVILKGVLAKIGTTQKAKSGKTEFCKISLFKPGYVDEFGDKVGQDMTYEVTVFNKSIEKLLGFIEGGKVELATWLSSQPFEDKATGEARNFLQLTLNDIKGIADRPKPVKDNQLAIDGDMPY